VIKVSKEDKKIVWNYQYAFETNDQVPGILHQDAQDPNNMYLIGRLDG
jgi:hypothetical protein